MILGIDEVGRGAWAGPLVVGAVVLRSKIDGLRDSKLLTKSQRESFAEEIYTHAHVGLGWVNSIEIDEIGLGPSLKLGALRAVEQINDNLYDEIIVDGVVNLLSSTKYGILATPMKKADQLIASVSAASIVAKVARDKHMVELDTMFPGYGFRSHVGYGTALHQKRIIELGPSEVHRKSFKPIQEIEVLTTTSTGRKAEKLVAEFLKSKGHDILEMNWKTKFCEVDIISKLSNRHYFTEVKYRNRPAYGDGLEAITKTKLDKMKLAANLYMINLNSDFSLAVASVSDDPMVLTEWIELV